MVKRKVGNDIKINKVFMLVSFLFFVAIIIRISYLSLSKTVDGINLQQFASKRTTRTDVLYARRGSIFDKNGNVLAQNVSSYTVIAYLSESRTTNPEKPQHVVDKEYTAKKLSDILGIDYDSLLSLLSKKKVYQTELGSKARGITELTKEEIEKLNLPGIDFIETQKRNYPYGRFLSYTLGYAKVNETVAEDGTVEDKIVGELGIESKFNKELSGTDGYNFYQKDRNGYKIAGTDEVTVKAVDGNDIYLTIDSTIQLFLEQAISKVMSKYKADWISMMVADAKTGAILASSVYPSFDPNKRDIKNYLDYNVSLAFEPGSTMKIYSYMAAIESGKYDGNAKYKSGVYTTKDGTQIGDWNRNGWGYITYDQGFALSSNVAALSLVKDYINADYLKDYYKKLGFGSTTGIELANEVSGKINFKYETEIYNATFGQGITTTPIQNIKALTSISNNGILLQPYIIDKIVDQDTGEIIYKGKKKELGRVASDETVKKIKDLMASVVNGNSKTSTGYIYKLDGYNIIAKTGTAQVAKKTGGYGNEVIRGFAGMFPKDDPEVIIYMAVKNPSNMKILTEVIKEIVKNSSNYLNIFDGNTNKTEKLKSIKLDSFINKDLESVKKVLNDNSIQSITIGNGNKVVSQYPNKGTNINKLDKVFLVTNSAKDVMINLSNLSKSEILTYSNLVGLNVEFESDGYCVEQSIKPGNKFNAGDTLKIKLKDKK